MLRHNEKTLFFKERRHMTFLYFLKHLFCAVLVHNTFLSQSHVSQQLAFFFFRGNDGKKRKIKLEFHDMNAHRLFYCLMLSSNQRKHEKAQNS